MPKYDTDKYENGFIPFYTELLKPYHDKDIKLLEIGIFHGGSLRLFSELLPKASITGVDILDRPDGLPDSIKTMVIDQNDSEKLLQLPNYDIVIDDGSHMTKETKNCFDILWPRLKFGGIYVIEDWAVGYKYPAPETVGMHDLIFDIASRKNRLDISSFELTIDDNWCSHATFRKG